MAQELTAFIVLYNGKFIRVYPENKVNKVLAEKDAEIRRLKRALWMHRTITANLNKEGCKAMREYNPFFGIGEYKWQEVERKCRAKAEKFKEEADK